MNDLISVIIPTFNRSLLVKRAIKSVLDQTYKDIELIVVDDGSTDDTADSVNSFNDSRVVFLKHTKNQGAAAARNTGIRVAKGRYIAFLDSDDEFLPEKIEIQRKAFESLDPVPALVYTNTWFEEHGNTRLEVPDDRKSQYVPRSRNIFPTNTILVGPETWMVDRKALESVGYFDEDLLVYEDRDLFVRIAKDHPVYYLHIPLSIVHVAEGHLFSLGRLKMDFIRSKEAFLKKHYDWINRDRASIVKLYSDMADGLIKLSQKEMARKYYLKIVKRSPLKISSLRKYIQTFF